MTGSIRIFLTPQRDLPSVSDSSDSEANDDPGDLENFGSDPTIGPVADDEFTQEWATGDGDSDSDGFLDHIASTVEEDLGINVQERLGDYEIKRLLGSGGMGQVFLAEHVRMQRTVALKTLPVHRLGDEKAVDRFFAEVRAASRVMHPNIVTAFDAGEHEGVPYLAMEFIDGMTLTQVVSQGGPLPVDEAASVIRQASLGLLHAHRAHIVHRDVKPGNLMRGVDGVIKVLDLGLAQISSLAVDAVRPTAIGSEAELTRAKKRGKLIGTLSFMSPEQLEDPEAVDSRSDIYSLGATLYFLLTGRPPYQGEFLDLVYGHRHGEIPDLMQVRDDIDMNFANVFQRMMAKSPGERYNSLDEVIDDLSGYTPSSAPPSWLGRISGNPVPLDSSTLSGGSTYGGESTVIRRTEVVGLDIGLFDIAAASADLNGNLRHLTAGEQGQPLFRMVMTSRGGRLSFGPFANERRGVHPERVVHCVPMYIGQRLVEREIAGRQCPPEVLLASMIRRVMQLAWNRKQPPEAIAVTIPAVYDQLHRRSIMQAATLAGLRSIRLVDRSLAAAQMLITRPVACGDDDRDQDDVALDAPADQLGMTMDLQEGQNLLFVGLTGQACEVAVIRLENGRLRQAGTSGHWHHGTLAWIQRLVDMTAEAFIESIRLDPRKSLRRAARLQIACERAIQTLVMLPSVKITIEAGGRQVSVVIDRQTWLRRCGDLIEQITDYVALACDRAGTSPDEVDHCLALGSLLRLLPIKQSVFAGLKKGTPIQPIDGNDVACGAAACLAAELPGRGDIAMPPRNVTSQQIGVLVEDSRQRSRIMPIIPRGTLLPARTNRRITAGKQKQRLSMSLVESSGHRGEQWQSLGQYDFDLAGPADLIGMPDQQATQPTRMMGFEIDVNGLLAVRAQTPGVPGSTKLSPLPAPAIDAADMPGWIEWLNEQTTE